MVGISRSPTRFSAQAIWSGNTAAIRSSAAMRASCGGTFLPPRKRGRASDTPATQRQRVDEHRRVEQRLDQHVAHAAGMQIARDLGELEAVRRGERQHDVVLGRRRLQLEIELAAEALAQRQAPGAVDAAAEGRMDDQLHAAGLVEEALEHDRVLRRQAARARHGRRRDTRPAARRPARRCRARSISQRSALLAARIDRAARAAISARRRDTDCRQLVAAPRRLAEPERDVRRLPCASSTRTMPRSTRRMR